MTTEEKKIAIKELVSELITFSSEQMIEGIDRALNSGTIDFDEWEESNGKMIIPKCILLALLEKQIDVNDAKGTSHQRRVRKQVKLIRYYV